jgi:YHS domain-containing protein
MRATFQNTEILLSTEKVLDDDTDKRLVSDLTVRRAFSVSKVYESKPVRKGWKLEVLGAIVASSLAASSVAVADPGVVARTPPFQQPNIKHTLADFLTARPVAEKLHIKKTDPLLRPPFADQPITSPKGLAAKIRAEELDVKNRVKAIEYLGTVDCRAYPEAQAALIDALHNDKYEAVRYEAAKSLRSMLSCENHEQRGAGIVPRRVHGNNVPKKRLPTGYANCPGCCNADVLNALSKTAYDRDEFGCLFEPSLKVREMAVEAIQQCCEACKGQNRVIPVMPTYAVPQDYVPEVPPAPPGEQAPPVLLEQAPPQALIVPPALEQPASVAMAPLVPPVEATQAEPAPRAQPLPLIVPEQTPSQSEVTQSVPAAPVSLVKVTAPEVDLPACKALNGFCPVAMANKKLVRANSGFKANYDGRSYYFSSAAALEEFSVAPSKYALSFRGCDPVAYAESGTHQEGSLIREYQGTRYSFTSVENWEKFQVHPESYLERLKQNANIVRLSHGQGF